MSHLDIISSLLESLLISIFDTWVWRRNDSHAEINYSSIVNKIFPTCKHSEFAYFTFPQTVIVS